MEDANFSERRKALNMKSIEYNTTKIRQHLSSLNVPLSGEADGLTTHLGDIREACVEYLFAIDELLLIENKENRKALIEVLSFIRYDFDLHIRYHLKKMKKPLSHVIEQLEKNVDDMGK